MMSSLSGRPGVRLTAGKQELAASGRSRALHCRTASRQQRCLGSPKPTSRSFEPSCTAFYSARPACTCRAGSDGPAPGVTEMTKEEFEKLLAEQGDKLQIEEVTGEALQEYFASQAQEVKNNQRFLVNRRQPVRHPLSHTQCCLSLP